MGTQQVTAVSCCPPVSLWCCLCPHGVKLIESNTQGDSVLSYKVRKDQTEVLLQLHDYQFRKPEVILKLLLIQHCCVEQLIKVFLWASESDKQFQRFPTAN